MLLATKGEGLEGDARDTYGVAPMGYVLPNPSLMEVRESEICKSATPKVLFLGRLDPIKRPWLFAELARRFPEVEFHMAGQSHFKGEGGWVPHDPPPNLHLRGHLTDEAKQEALTTSWVLVNTSIHEFAPVSGFEAMVCKTPVISMEDSGRLASRFGVFAGRFDGDGMEGMDALEGSLRSLIGDDARRTQMGETARRWVLHHHGREPFLAAFARLCTQAGILPPRF